MLSNHQITLRALEPEDLDLLYHWENNSEVWEVSNTHTPMSKFILANYIKSSDADIWEKKELRLMIEDIQHKAVGTIEVFDFDPYHQRAGLGIIIFEKADRRNGIASSAIQLIKEYLKNEIGVYQVYANIASNNQASIKLFEQLNFQKIGLKKHWIRRRTNWMDEIMYQCFL